MSFARFKFFIKSSANVWKVKKKVLNLQTVIKDAAV